MPRPLATLSLLLSLSLLAAWPLSCWRAVNVQVPATPTRIEVFRGLLLWERPNAAYRRAVMIYEPTDIDLALETGGWSFAGFGRSGPAFVTPMVWCPIWFVATLLLIPPWWWARGRKAAGRGFEVKTAG